MANTYFSGHGTGYGKGSFDRGGDVRGGRFEETGRFGRMLPYLRSLKSFKPGPDELGKVDGPMDGGAAFDPSQDNLRIKAGYTFLGQFIDHDLTLDATSSLEQQIDPTATRNFRTPAFELDSVYGLGPKVQPYLYQKDNPGKFLTGETPFDLPRNAEGIALIGDPRNDENLIVAQLHALFLHFHNKVFDEATDASAGIQERFEQAQHLVRWHYQWIVINEFLTRTVGRDAIQVALDQLPFSFPEHGNAFMPVEFSVAAYRFGHSQVRPAYRLSSSDLPPPPRVAAIFPEQADAPENIGDLRGRRRIPEELRIDWDAFFGPTAQPGKQIDIRIATPLLRLPNTVIDPAVSPVGSPEATVRSLASRNLQRGLDARLPSGQTVARHFRTSPRLTQDQVWKDIPGGEGETPLWFYCLREAEVLNGGFRLAGVGAQIVARTFAAILAADKASFIVRDPEWKPTLGTGDTFTVSDLINFTLGTNIGSEDVDALPDRPDSAGAPEQPVAAQ